MVFLRVDANVPLEDGVITDDGRIRAFLPTLDVLRNAGARVVVASHLGRPEGVADPKYSLAPVATRLADLIQGPVRFIDHVSGPAAFEGVREGAPGSVAVIQNLRFDPRETSKVDSDRAALAAEWADHVDFVVSDGFGVVHRKQASVVELPSLRPSVAGLLIEREVDVVTRLTKAVEHPYTVVLGGSKVSDKLGVIEALLPAADNILIGGGMVFTVLAAQGHAIASSLVERDSIPTVRDFLSKAAELGVEIVLPDDIVVAESFAADSPHVVLSSDALESGPAGAAGIGLDIGPSSQKVFAEVIRRSKTVFWNGPMGVFEFAAFSAGTRAVAEALTAVQGLSVVGGGDSAAAVRALGFNEDSFGHISTGGGASLEFLEGTVLPGLEILGWQS
ncbi:MAG: phosphoglycerate kinase [actinobacterium acMicro-4]|nr:MAG: phosphoglycerate kinase [actinobacterium acMicro-4]